MNNNRLWVRIFAAVAGFIYITFGILMIQNPSTTLSALSLFLTWLVILGGLLVLAFGIFIKRIDEEIGKANLTDGALLLVLGLILMFGSFINNSLILAYLLIFWIIMDSVMQLQLSFFIPNSGIKLFIVILDVIIISYSIWLLFNPSGAESFLVLYTGVAFISTGVGKIIKGY